jgi:hypothetical protein
MLKLERSIGIAKEGEGKKGKLCRAERHKTVSLVRLESCKCSWKTGALSAGDGVYRKVSQWCGNAE